MAVEHAADMKENHKNTDHRDKKTQQKTNGIKWAQNDTINTNTALHRESEV